MNLLDHIRQQLDKLRASAKGEYSETVVAGRILMDMLRGDKPTEGEVRFVKSQSMDLLKILGIAGTTVVPGSSIMLLALEQALRPYGISILPSKHEMPKSLKEYRIFLDDERMVHDVYKDHYDFVTVRNLEEFKRVIFDRGVPTFISFDHDLGEDETGAVRPGGYDVAKWLVYEMELDISEMGYKVHSWNIQTRDQINGLLDNWKKELDNRLRSQIRSIINEATSQQRVSFIMAVPQDIMDISGVFERNGYQLLLVGGCVRDAVMGKSPKDYDLVTDALPDEVERIMSAAGYKTLPTGKAFGIINVITQEDQYEIATFRSDGASSDGRRPDSVEFSDIHSDAMRRDLTINALYYDIQSREIVDLVGGLDDIRNGTVRTVGKAEDRFNEDRLRILRAIRFAARIGHDVDADIDAALKRNNSMTGVSAERIRDEFLKGVKSAQSVVAFLRMLDRYGLLKQIFPGARVSADFTEERDPVVLIAWLLLGNGPEGAAQVLQRAKYTHDEAKAVKFLISLKDLSVPNVYPLKKAEASAGVGPEQTLRFGASIGLDKRLVDAFVHFKLSITGDDLKGKVAPGPDMGKMIRQMETEKFAAMVR